MLINGLIMCSFALHVYVKWGLHSEEQQYKKKLAIDTGHYKISFYLPVGQFLELNDLNEPSH